MLRPREFKRKRIFLIILAVIIILSLISFFGFKTFKDNKLTRFDIDAQNINCTTSGEITSFLQSKNINYFYFKSDEVETDLKKKFFCIGKIESEVSYPDRLKLNILGREGKFVVSSIDPEVDPNPTIELSLDQMNATQSTTEAFPPKIMREILDSYKEASPGAMYLVDNQGVIFEETMSNLSFPRLSIFSANLRIGYTIQDNIIQKVSEILDKIKIMDIPTDNLLVVGDRLIINSNPRVTFGLNKPIDRQAASLQLILRQAKMKSDPESKDSKSVESIDLRFDRPVVVYSK